MVRKRTRRYESDDNDSDSDVDFGLENQSRPAPKKYSLRERRSAPAFTSDFDYYGLDDEDGEARKQSSDDEDFEVQGDAEGVRPYFEPDPAVAPENGEGLIDFEDIIRADIVVNRNRIDYDNIIEKTEIKLTQPKKRGRKPKNRTEEPIEQEVENSSVLCTPELESLSAYEPDDPDAVNVGEEKKENDDKENTLTTEPEQETVSNGELLTRDENGDSEKVATDSDLSVIKSTNGVEVTDSDPLVALASQESQKIDDDDDDVILLGEINQPVIVLDD